MNARIKVVKKRALDTYYDASEARGTRPSTFRSHGRQRKIWWSCDTWEQMRWPMVVGHVWHELVLEDEKLNQVVWRNSER